MNAIRVLQLIVLFLMLAVPVILFNHLPDRLATHWDSQGNVNGYMGKFWGLFLLPLLSIALFVFFLLIPKIDPLKENIKGFIGYYEWFILIFLAFLAYVHFLSIAWNLGYKVSFISALMPAFAVLFYFVGILMANAKRNWFIGIRTPWTLANDKVWKRTHRIGSKLFKLGGVLCLFLVFLPRFAFAVFLVYVLGISIFLFVYSYIIYSKPSQYS